MTEFNVSMSPSLYLTDDLLHLEEGMWPITQSLIIGREHADIALALPQLSRRHAQVALQGSLCVISDLNSKNGTAVNGNLLDEDPHYLQHGDLIVLAGVVELKFNDPNATAVTPRLGKLKGLWIDRETKDVWVDAERLTTPLSKKQQQLLELIASADPRVISRDEIISSLWPESARDIVSNDAVDSLIKRLRKRLTVVEHGRPVLEVVRGHGIRLVPDR